MDIHIYKMTNLIDGKAYIGQTIDVDRRMKQHWNSYESEVSREWHKAGWNNFHIQVLKTVHNPKTASKTEQYYIEKYGTMMPHGYNAAHAPMKGNQYPNRGKKVSKTVNQYARIWVNGEPMKLTESELKKRYKIDFKDLRSFKGKEMSCFDPDRWAWNQIKLCEFCN